MLLIAVAGGIEVLNALLKLLFHRPRPELAFVHLDTYSFPSGHAAGSAAIYSMLAVLAARGVRTRGRVLVGSADALVLTIGFSRLYLGAHYLSDALAGLALGPRRAQAGLADELALGQPAGSHAASTRAVRGSEADADVVGSSHQSTTSQPSAATRSGTRAASSAKAGAEVEERRQHEPAPRPHRARG